MLLLITHLRLLRASRSRNLSSLFAYRATSSPFYAHNKAPPKLPRHLCASTGVCSLLLLITHLRLLRASRSRNLSLLFAYRATSSPFYAHNKAPPKLFKAPLCKHRCMFLATTYNSPQIATRFAFPQSVLIIRISRDFVALLCS